MGYTKKEHELIKEVRLLCAEKGVRPLSLFFIGTRQYGYPTHDSEHDVLFVFKYPTDDYSKLENPSFDIETPEANIRGWDIHKFCDMLVKSELTAFEALNSKRYEFDSRYTKRTFYNDIQWIVRASGLYDSIRMAITMIGHTNRIYDNYKNSNGNDKLKNFLDFCRLVLSADYSMRHDEYPPIKLMELLDGAHIDEDGIKEFIFDIILKRAEKEPVIHLDVCTVGAMDICISKFMKIREELLERLQEAEYKEVPEKCLNVIDRLIRQHLVGVK